MRKIKIDFAHCDNYLSAYDTFVYRKKYDYFPNRLYVGNVWHGGGDVRMECFKCAQT